LGFNLDFINKEKWWRHFEDKNYTSRNVVENYKQETHRQA